MIRTPIILDKQYCCPYNEPTGYIYKVTNIVNGHYYIGKHEFHHPYMDNSYHGSGKRLKLAYDKYGIESFSTTILEWSNGTVEDLFNLEKYWINVFNSYELGYHYNLTEGGDGQSSSAMTGSNNPNYGKHMSDEQKEHLSKIKTGTHMSKSTRHAMSVSRTGCKNSFYNKHHTKESVEKIRASCPDRTGANNPNYGNHKLSGINHPNYGKHLSDETKQKISKSHTGKPLTESHKQKISEAALSLENYGMRGKHHTQESRKNMGLHHTYKYGSDHPMSKSVVQLSLSGEYIQSFGSLTEVKQKLGFKSTDLIAQCCKHKKESYKGYKWVYYDDFI